MLKIKRKTHNIDATGKSLGRLASEIAILLHGKNKPEFMPNIDSGDFVIVDNVRKIKFTGRKFYQKKYHHYTGYPGGIKTKKLSEWFGKKPQEVLKYAVYNMLPKNKLRKGMMKRLNVL